MSEQQKYALVTGGSEGVGFAVAEMLARRGMHVLLVARDRVKLEAAREQIVAAGGHASMFPCDVSDRAALVGLRASVDGVAPHLAVLVNAAGTFRWDPSDIDLLAVNAKSKEFILEIFDDMLIEGSWVVNISSQAALFAVDDPRRVGEEAYVGSMARVDALSAAFAARRPDVRVHVSHPPLMKGRIAETQFRGRAGFEDVDFDALPGPEIVADEVGAALGC